jgi:hypothetical protein
MAWMAQRVLQGLLVQMEQMERTASLAQLVQQELMEPTEAMELQVQQELPELMD